MSQASQQARELAAGLAGSYTRTEIFASDSRRAWTVSSAERERSELLQEMGTGIVQVPFAAQAVAAWLRSRSADVKDSTELLEVVKVRAVLVV